MADSSTNEKELHQAMPISFPRLSLINIDKQSGDEAT